MNGDIHVRACESLRGWFLLATRPIALTRTHYGGPVMLGVRLQKNHRYIHAAALNQ